MRIKNIVSVLFLIITSSLLATDFKVANQSSIINVGYALVYGNKPPVKLNYVAQNNWKRDSTGLNKLNGIWIEYWESNDAGGVAYYYADLRQSNIPVMRVGIPIVIGDNGTIVVGNEVIPAQQVNRPSFVR